MTQHQQLQKKINGIIQPDAEKLLVIGCEIYDTLENELLTVHKIDTEDNLIVYCYNEIEKEICVNFMHGQDECIILGQKLNLEAVFMALGKIHRVIEKPKYIEGLIIIKVGSFNWKIMDWHLLLPPDQQPIETQKALFEIFNV